MAYDQGAAYEPPRRQYYGQQEQQQQAPVRKQQHPQYQQQQQYSDYQGYEQGYGAEQHYQNAVYNGYNDGQQGYEQQQHGAYEQSGYVQHGPEQYARQPLNGYGQPSVNARERHDNQYEQQSQPAQERYYDPRYQQRQGRSAQASSNGHSQDPRVQPAAPQTQQQQQQPGAREASWHDPRNGYAPQQHAQPVQASRQRMDAPVNVVPDSRSQRSGHSQQQPVQQEPSSRSHGQGVGQHLRPVQPSAPAKVTKPDPKKMTMEEWKASERAKMHAAAAGLETLAQDTAFPTFPTKKKEARPGGSALSIRSGEEQPRPSTSSSRPPLSRDNSHQDVVPAQTEQNLQVHRPSLDRQPFSYEPSHEPTQARNDVLHRPPEQYTRDAPARDARPDPSESRAHQGDGRHQPVAQYEQASRGQHSQGYAPQSKARAPPMVVPIDTAQAQARRPAAMDHLPLSPAYVPPRPSTAQAARSPLARQPQEQLFSPTSQYSQFDSPLEQRALQPPPHNGYAQQPQTSQHRAHDSSVDDVYAGYYGGNATEPVQVAPAPASRDQEIEQEMPDFDSAAPNQTSQLHKRLQTADRQPPDSAPLIAPPPMPAFARQQSGNSVQSLPVQGRPPYAQHEAAAASQPNLANMRGQSHAAPNGFVFGVPGEQQVPHRQHGADPRVIQQQQYSQPRPPYANDVQERRSMDDARGMPVRGGPPRPAQMQGIHPGGRGPTQRPDFDRLATSQIVMTDPGQQRIGSVPPTRQGPQSSTAIHGQVNGAPLTQQRSAPGPGQPQRQSNPDALPQHPTPVRPGLMHSSPRPANNRPLPVRTYDNQSIASTQSRKPSLDISDRPITQAELDRIRAAVEANPTSNKTALLYAKKLIEAADTLASDNGRLDARTSQRNREKYILDAHKRIKKLVSAGYPEAQFYFADCYGQGLLGLQVDTKEAFNLYQAAAKAGYPAAAYRTAVCCEMGPEEGGGTRRDYPKAVQWYRRASALGDVPAMFKLGMILLKGLLGTPRNIGEAASWLKRAAERADKDNPHALHELGLLYESGNTNPELRNKLIADDAYALQLFRQAADLGYKHSQYRLGQAHEYGTLGLGIDNRASIGWYSKAAAQGEHHAELALSGWYLTGAEGILEHNDTEAYLWARKAAGSEPPLAKALFAMGYFSEQGIGCPRDVEEARRWYGRAASYKFPKALERLEELKKSGGKGQKVAPANGKLTRKDQKKDKENCAVM
ncbi:hypothetical protein B0A48_11644 [Cryoendolithus antarcticus]|uniref:HCP-like protein n=1 Tax=Cryoendolithus antarcticus TaxID=1507870 RepID=A0A1V8ST66_9PEZI|nr:hypothetical protein B0A48_11644 [Cryoendolithus antarcticus]